MSIEKLNYTTLKHQRIPYAIISNEVIQNITNHVAGFIWVYLQTLPEHWEVNKWHIMKHFNISERTYKTHMKYLKDNKLIRYQQLRNERGEFLENNLIVCNGEDFIELIRGAKNCTPDRSAKNPLCGEIAPHTNTILNNKKNNISLSRNKKSELKPIEYQETLYTQNNELEEYKDSKELSENTFKQFWELYPTKKAEKRARLAWQCQKCYLIFDKIMEKLREQVSKDRAFIDGFAPNPDRYIHEERWNDEIQPVKNNKVSASTITDWDIDLHLDII